jgi:formate hydrogenlyase subunit 4
MVLFQTDFVIITQIVGVISAILITAFIGTLFRSIYEQINHPENRIFKRKIMFGFRELWKNLNETPDNSQKMDTLFYRVTPYFSIILISVLSTLLPIHVFSTFANVPLSIILTFLILITISLLFALTSVASNHPTKINTAKNWINTTLMYYLPIIISIISIISQYSAFESNPATIPSYLDILNFQISYEITFWGLKLPALFIFLNPFSAISVISAVTGILRKKKLENPKNEPLNTWDLSDEYNGRHLFLLILEQNMKLFIYAMIFLSLFLANGSFLNLHPIYLLLIQLLFALVFIIVLGWIGKGKPRTSLERGIAWYIRSPFVFAVLGIIWAAITINFPIFSIQLI